jgi:hypothetical protein
VDSMQVIGIILGSSVLASLIAALFSRQIHSETVALKYITEERAKWRENIKSEMRNLCAAIHAQCNVACKLAEIRKISTYIKLNLNPDPKETLDNKIIIILAELCEKPSYDKFKELEAKVQHLLKHDWERAKVESKNIFAWHSCLPMALALSWLAFYLFLKDTAIYLNLQKIPVVGSNYKEVGLFIALTLLPFCAWGFFYPRWKQSSIKKNANKT